MAGYVSIFHSSQSNKARGKGWTPTSREGGVRSPQTYSFHHSRRAVTVAVAEGREGRRNEQQGKNIEASNGTQTRWKIRTIATHDKLSSGKNLSRLDGNDKLKGEGKGVDGEMEEKDTTKNSCWTLL